MTGGDRGGEADRGLDEKLTASVHGRVRLEENGSRFYLTGIAVAMPGDHCGSARRTRSSRARASATLGWRSASAPFHSSTNVA